MSVDDLGVDMMTVVGHKFGGPRIGALYHKCLLEPIFLGGGQQSGRRAGTEDVASAVGLSVAAQAAVEALDVLDVRRKTDMFLSLLQVAPYFFNDLF